MIDFVDGDHRAECPDGTGVAFEEVEHHFKTNSDEACFLVSLLHGNVSIVGEIQKRNHEQETGNSRVLITLLESGSAAGAVGATPDRG